MTLRIGRSEFEKRSVAVVVAQLVKASPGESVTPIAESFRSKHCYPRGEKLRTAVPFSMETREASAVLVPGRIAHVRQVSDGVTWVCGVEFLKE